MKRIVRFVGTMVVCGAAPLLAQSSSCAAGPTQDACQQALDVYQYMAAQLSTAIAGGNATLGQGGSVGGLGHFVIDLRANAVQASIPQLNDLSPRITGSSPARQFATKSSYLPMPVVDAAIGLFSGIPIPGLTNVGGVDLLVSASYIPKVSQDNVTVDPSNPLKLGYGVRVSALSEGIVMPGLSATYLKRDLPTVALSGASNGDSLSVDNLGVNTTAWRIVASKNLILFGLAAGYGRDTYTSSASVSAAVQAVPGVYQRSSPFTASQSVTRNNMFADLSMNMVLFKIVGEVGQVSGGTLAQPTYNTFQGKGTLDSRLYASVGIRFGL